MLSNSASIRERHSFTTISLKATTPRIGHLNFFYIANYRFEWFLETKAADILTELVGISLTTTANAVWEDR